MEIKILDQEKIKQLKMLLIDLYLDEEKSWNKTDHTAFRRIDKMVRKLEI